MAARISEGRDVLTLEVIVLSKPDALIACLQAGVPCTFCFVRGFMFCVSENIVADSTLTHV